MKRILIFLAFVISILLVAKNISAKDNSDDFKVTNIGRPYVVAIIETDGNTSKEIKGISVGTDPFSIARDLGAEPYTEDRLKSFPDIKMNIGSKITLYRAPVISIKDGKRSKVVRSWTETVGELFIEQKIEIGKDDKVNFSSDTEIEDGTAIVITRVAITTIIEPETIKYSTIKKANPSVEKGNKKTLQAGKNGIKNKFYLVRREDGEEVSRSLTKTEIAEESIDEIIEYGTKIVVLDSGKATWYIRSNAMLAAHNSIPKGTKVKIVNTSNGKSVVATISGGGIYHDDNVVVDLSTAAFEALGVPLGAGKINNVRVEKYYPEDQALSTKP